MSVEPPGFQRTMCPACGVGVLGFTFGDKTVRGWCGECGHLKPRASARRTPTVTWDGSRDDIRRIPSAWYVPLLTGEEVGRGNMVRCVFHDDEHPSMHVQDNDGGWCCHGCGKRGGLLEFYTALRGVPMPVDSHEFVRLIHEVNEALGTAG